MTPASKISWVLSGRVMAPTERLTLLESLQERNASLRSSLCVEDEIRKASERDNVSWIMDGKAI